MLTLHHVSGETSVNLLEKPSSYFGRNLYPLSGETLNDLRSSLVLRMLGQMYYELFEWCGHGYSSTNTFISLSPPPLCMQCGRYSFCGIHAAALLKHTVVGWCLHHADYYCACGVSHLWYYIPVLPWLSCHHNNTHTTHTFYRTRPT